MSEDLRCTAECDYPVALLHIAGHLDAPDVSILRTEVLDCLSTDPESLIIDFTGAVIGTDDCPIALAALARQSNAWPGSALVLAEAPSPLVTAVHRAGVDVPAYPSVAAARRALAAPPGHRFRELLPPATVAAPHARRLVERACLSWSVPDVLDAAQLVMTELVANAVRHVGGEFTVTVSLRGGYLRISVADDDPTLPRPNRPDPSDEHGRGLLMIESLSTDWGATPLGVGKVVWAKMALPPVAANQPGSADGRRPPTHVR